MDKYKTGVATIHQNLRKLLKGRKGGYKAWELVLMYARRFGKLYADAAITARLREMRDVTCRKSDYTYSIGRK